MTNDLLIFLGCRIRELRKSKNYTQDRFAELIGIDAKHLSRIECSKTQPSLNLLKKISCVLEIDISDLFNNKHFKNKNELINEIDSILVNSDLNKIRLFYKILKTIVE